MATAAYKMIHNHVHQCG